MIFKKFELLSLVLLLLRAVLLINAGLAKKIIARDKKRFLWEKVLGPALRNDTQEALIINATTGRIIIAFPQANLNNYCIPPGAFETVGPLLIRIELLCFIINSFLCLFVCLFVHKY